MKILAVDTATRSCSVALMNEDHLVAEFTLARRQTHSRHLMAMIADLLHASGETPAAIDGFAVTLGPGSFTGLRIGSSTVKGLAEALQRPMAGVSTLAALAMQALPANKLVCPVIDARRKEVYAGAYRLKNGVPTAVAEEQVLTPEQVAARFDEPCLYIGDGALLYRERLLKPDGNDEVSAIASVHVIHAAAVARLARPFFLSGLGRDPADFVPIYLRRSDAEQTRSTCSKGKISNIH
jgi:tRNA threonylcarbamoyladenosine biosynthesis protein TsaB